VTFLHSGLGMAASLSLLSDLLAIFQICVRLAAVLGQHTETEELPKVMNFLDIRLLSTF